VNTVMNCWVAYWAGNILTIWVTIFFVCFIIILSFFYISFLSFSCFRLFTFFFNILIRITFRVCVTEFCPLAVLFYSSSLYMVCIATLVSVVVVNLARNQHVSPLPWLLKNLLTGWLGHILGLGHIIAQVQCIQWAVALEQ